MNNITLILLISFTKALSFIPKAIFTNKNSPLWSLLSKLLKKRRKIIEANINHCYQDKTPEWRNDLVEKIWGETFLALYENNFAWNADKRINKYKCEVQNGELLADAQKQNTGVLLL